VSRARTVSDVLSKEDFLLSINPGWDYGGIILLKNFEFIITCQLEERVRMD